MAEAEVLSRQELAKLKMATVSIAISGLESLGGDALLSGEDSGLTNAWEEICVQVRGEESFYWNFYIDVIDDFLAGALTSFSPDQLQALWLSTDNGWDWAYDHQDEPGLTPPVDTADIVADLRGMLMSDAEDYESENIYRYLYGADDDEECDETEDEDVAGEASAPSSPVGSTITEKSFGPTGNDRLRVEIARAIAGTSIGPRVAEAALNDFMRALHEVYVKGRHEQKNFLSQVDAVLGYAATTSLAKVIHAEKVKFDRSSVGSDCLLSCLVQTICEERGFDTDRGRFLFIRFLVTLDEGRYLDGDEYDSPLLITLWGVGEEAVYHLGGLYAGDEAGIIRDEIMCLDFRLKRFHTTVERWRMEMEWDQEDVS